MKRSAFLLLVLGLLLPCGVAWAALPGKARVIAGSSRWCHNVGGRGGHTSTQCDYSGTRIGFNGWKLTTGTCKVSGTFDANEHPFTTTMSYGASSYSFSLIPSTGTGQSIHFGVSCAMSWTGAVGLTWSHRVTGGSPGAPVHTLRVENHTSSRHVAVCRILYLTNLHAYRPFTWAPKLPAHGRAHLTIRVWRIQSMRCAYTLHHSATGHGSA